MTDSKLLMLWATGEMTPTDSYSSLYLAPSLLLTCFDGSYGASIDWGGRFISGDSIPTEYRVDDLPVVGTTSSDFPSNDMSSFSNPKSFTQNIMQADKLLVRVTDFDYETLMAEFRVTGLSDHIGRLNCFDP